MSLKKELVELMGREGANVAALCRRFGVSRKTAYKWAKRYKEQGEAGLAERSRRPRLSPRRTPPAAEAAVLTLRDRHPVWGPCKLARRLRDQGRRDVPAPSTVGVILERHGRVGAHASEAAAAWKRFERPAPNDLWQADFKGHFALADGKGPGGKGTRCHPLTVLDDHSRYNLLLAACLEQTTAVVKEHFTALFRRHGLPAAMLFDNGPPWGCSHSPLAYTALELWLLRLGVLVLHGRPYHPQTQGKEERFHRTLLAEVLQGRAFADPAAVQAAFDPWRQVYNFQRPHAALGLAAPGTRYAPSPRGFPEALPELVYGDGDQVRAVNACGVMGFGGRRYFLGEGFAGQRLGLRPADGDGVWAVHYGRFEVGRLDQRAGTVRGVRRKAEA